MDYKDGIDIGLFSFRDYDIKGDENGCRNFAPDDDIDAGQKAARAFAIMGFMFHTVAFGMVFMMEYFTTWYKQTMWNVSRGLIVASAVCSALVFSAFADCADVDGIKCVPGPSGIIGVFNFFVLIAVIAISFLTSVPQHPVYSVTRWNASAIIEATPPDAKAGMKKPIEDVVPVTPPEPTTNSHTEIDA